MCGNTKNCLSNRLTGYVRSPSNIVTPKKIITQLPIMKVTVCTFAGRRLWPKPLIDANRLCQDNDARNAPATKNAAFTEERGEFTVIPRIRVVK